MLLGSFMSDYLLLNVNRTKELVVDFSRTGIGTRPGIVEDYKYLHVHLNDGLDWSTNTDAVYKKEMSRHYFLRKLRSFNMETFCLWSQVLCTLL